MPDNRLGPQLTSPDPRDALPILTTANRDWTSTSQPLSRGMPGRSSLSMSPETFRAELSPETYAVRGHGRSHVAQIKVPANSLIHRAEAAVITTESICFLSNWGKHSPVQAGWFFNGETLSDRLLACQLVKSRFPQTMATCNSVIKTIQLVTKLNPLKVSTQFGLSSSLSFRKRLAIVCWCVWMEIRRSQSCRLNSISMRKVAKIGNRAHIHASVTGSLSD
jgi:hypothetical protein